MQSSEIRASREIRAAHEIREIKSNLTLSQAKGKILEGFSQEYFRGEINSHGSKGHTSNDVIQALFNDKHDNYFPLSANGDKFSEQLNTLKQHESSFFTGNHPRSVIDAAVLVFISHAIHKIKNPEKSQVNRITGLITSKNFAEKFKEFLQAMGVDPKQIKRISSSHLSNIKVNRLGFIHLNNLTVDLKLGFNNHNLETQVLSSMKNQEIRQLYTEDKLKALKKSATKYFSEKIIPSINKIKHSFERKKVILQIQTLMTMVNQLQRHGTQASINMKELLKIAQPIFANLSIVDRQEQIEFLQHVSIACTHRNVGQFAKQLIYGGAIVGAATAAIATEVIPIVAAGVMGAGAILATVGVALKLTGVATLVNNEISTTNDVRRTDISYLKRFKNYVNFGDRDNSITNTAKGISQLLANQLEIEDSYETSRVNKESFIGGLVEKEYSVASDESNEPSIINKKSGTDAITEMEHSVASNESQLIHSKRKELTAKEQEKAWDKLNEQALSDKEIRKFMQNNNKNLVLELTSILKNLSKYELSTFSDQRAALKQYAEKTVLIAAEI